MEAQCCGEELLAVRESVTTIKSSTKISRNPLVLTNSASPVSFSSIFFTADLFITILLLIFSPQYFYIAYSIRVIAFFPLRWNVSRRETRKHYFLLEFCAYIHFLNLAYLWSPWKPRGMFPVLFMFSNGPSLWAVYMVNNALVPHSIEKMCSLFTHTSPALLMWTLRWYLIPEEHEFEPCDNASSLWSSWLQLLSNSFPYYLIWAIYYSIIVLNLLEKRIIHYNNETSFRCLVQVNTDGFVSKLCNISGERYCKMYYIILHYTTTVLCMAVAFLSYQWKLYHFILISSFLLLSVYNGLKYYVNKQEKEA